MFALALLAALSFLPQDAAVAGLSYIDSSDGLQMPEMEGGRTEFEMGDVNGDGHVDLVSIGDHGSPFINTQEHGVMVWFGDGNGAWTVFQFGNFGYGGVALGDVNDDGLVDVGYGMHHDYSGNDLGDQILEVALGDGTGRAWTAWDDGLATNGETWGMFGTDFADVDNDGDLDVGSISFGCCAGIHVYLNHGDGTWTQSFGFVGGNSGMEFQFADFNADGNADFTASHGNATVYLGDGTGNYTNATGNLPFGPWRRGVSAGDVNDDGADDLAFRTSTGVAVLTMTSDGVWQDLSGSLATIGTFYMTQIADMNLDGHGDVLAFRDELVVMYAGDGQGGWTPLATIVLPDACDYAAFRAGVDVDHNGMPDLVLVQEEDCQIFTGGTNRPRCYVEMSIPAVPSIFAKHPRGGETLIAGSQRFIDWHAAVPTPGVGEGQPTVTLELSTTGPDGPWTVIAQNIPDNGRHQWRVPLDASGTDCRVRYTLHTAPEVQTITPSGFTILGADAVPVDPQTLNVVYGAHVSGGVAELRASDDAYVRIEQRPAFTPLLPLIRLEVAGTSPTDDPASLTTIIEAAATSIPSLPPQRLSQFDFDGASWTLLDERTATSQDTIVEVVIDTNAGRYIEDGTGTIRLRLDWFDPGNVFTPAWGTRTDQARWVVGGRG